jgi:ADP-ribosylglycohydrolase
MLEETQEVQDLRVDEVESEREKLFERIAGALFGGAIADSLGWGTEFARSKREVAKRFGDEYVRDFKPWEKMTGGRFNTYIDYVQPGEYSDDTQLTLCTARSLNPDGTFNAEHFAKKELPLWLDYARGAGRTITAAARALKGKGASWDNNFFTFQGRTTRLDYRDAGANGAAMRISPIALANILNPEIISREVAKNCIITHGHPRAILGALVYARALCFLAAKPKPTLQSFLQDIKDFTHNLNLDTLDNSLAHWIERWNSDSPQTFQSLWNLTQTEMLRFIDIAASSRQCSLPQVIRELGCFNPKTKGSGTSTVAATIAIFLRHGQNFEHTVLEAVNMIGTDTDTIGAMAASLVGAYQGYFGIPDRWAKQMQDYDYFLRVSETLSRIASRTARVNELLPDYSYEHMFRSRDIVSLTKSRVVVEGQRVSHPLFGLGWVTGVSSQAIRRKGGGNILLARVAFDVRQSCIFRAYAGQPTRRSAKA